MVGEFVWVGPFRISELLAKCLDKDQAWPPERDGVYLVSRRQWVIAPTLECEPLYYGGTTGRSDRFVTRIGDLVADMHGLYGQTTGHHSGGQSLYRWCDEHQVLPGELLLGWATAKDWCGRCAEIRLATEFGRASTILNRISPPRCSIHEL